MTFWGLIAAAESVVPLVGAPFFAGGGSTDFSTARIGKVSQALHGAIQRWCYDQHNKHYTLAGLQCLVLFIWLCFIFIYLYINLYSQILLKPFKFPVVPN